MKEHSGNIMSTLEHTRYLVFQKMTMH